MLDIHCARDPGFARGLAMRHLLTLALCSVALAACQPAAEEPADAPVVETPAAAEPVTTEDPAPLGENLNLVGTEPFWAIQIRNLRDLKLEGPNYGTITDRAAGYEPGDDRAAWTG